MKLVKYRTRSVLDIRSGNDGDGILGQLCGKFRTALSILDGCDSLCDWSEND